MTLPVYYVYGLADDASRGTLVPGAEFAFAGAEARHAGVVKRVRPGEEIAVVDGYGTRVTLAVTAADKENVRGTVQAVTAEPASPVNITLVQALAKGGRDEQALETATEYGVDAIVPWQAERSISRWDGLAKILKGTARWEATTLAAMKQSRRSWLPPVQPLLNSSALVEWIAQRTKAGAVTFICHEEAEYKLTEAIRELTSPADIGLIVGPEGGISAAELAAFETAGARRIVLGKHVLRTSSAGPWAIAVIRALLG